LRKRLSILEFISDLQKGVDRLDHGSGKKIDPKQDKNDGIEEYVNKNNFF